VELKVPEKPMFDLAKVTTPEFNLSDLCDLYLNVDGFGRLIEIAYSHPRNAKPFGK